MARPNGVDRTNPRFTPEGEFIFRGFDYDSLSDDKRRLYMFLSELVWMHRGTDTLAQTMEKASHILNLQTRMQKRIFERKVHTNEHMQHTFVCDYKFIFGSRKPKDC